MIAKIAKIVPIATIVRASKKALTARIAAIAKIVQLATIVLI